MKDNMISIKDNTVSAVNQMINSSLVYHLGNPNAKTRILVVGNSITRHGPRAEIGWDGDWGMAASAPEKDYVHRLFALLTNDGQDVFMRVSQCSAWERGFKEDNILHNYDEDRAFNADILVFRLGENVLLADVPYFSSAMRKFVAHICPNGRVIYTTCFWKNGGIDDAVKSLAQEREEVCVDIAFSVQERNMAIGKFAHSGVAMHPSDEGMEEIAKAIFSKLKKVGL